MKFCVSRKFLTGDAVLACQMLSLKPARRTLSRLRSSRTCAPYHLSFLRHFSIFLLVAAVLGLRAVFILTSVVDVQLLFVQAIDVGRFQAEELADADPEEQHVGRLDAGVLHVLQLVLPALLGLAVPVLPAQAFLKLVALRGQRVDVIFQRPADFASQAALGRQKPVVHIGAQRLAQPVRVEAGLAVQLRLEWSNVFQ